SGCRNRQAGYQRDRHVNLRRRAFCENVGARRRTVCWFPLTRVSGATERWRNHRGLPAASDLPSTAQKGNLLMNARRISSAFILTAVMWCTSELVHGQSADAHASASFSAVEV